jgi:SAM-dependent methyltransferase
VAVTRRSYNLIAASYEERTASPAEEFVAWRAEWAAAVRDAAPARSGARAGGAPARDGAPGGAVPARSGAPGDAAPARSGAPGTAAAPVVLDAGAGPGQHTEALATAGLRAVALDLSREMALRARRRGVPVVLGDQRRLPFGDGTFDGVWSSAALLHVPREDVPATLGEWRRVTRPGGLLALSTATGGTDGWEDPPYDTAGEHPPPRWYVYHDEAPLRALLDAAGWAVASVGTRPGAMRDWLQVRAVARG